MTAIYCAPWLWPGSRSTALEDGGVVVEGEVIAAVGPGAILREQFPQAHFENLTDALIIPGLINTHSHIELTAMRGFLDKEENDFVAWLKKLTLTRLERLTPEDLYVSAAWGAVEAVRSGITCLADASSAAYETLGALRDIGLRGTVYQESFGPDPNQASANLELLKDQVSRIRTLENSRLRVGVSPHAPYTVSAPQLNLICDFALSEGLPLMMHAAESLDEELLMDQGEGRFAAGFRARGIEWKAPGVSTIQYLKTNGVLRTQPLLAHCIRVDEADIQCLADTNSRVAHCPKSNAKLGHGRAKLARFLNKGVIVGLGTDSVASNNICDLIDEARFATLMARSEADPETFVSAQTALTILTSGGASALGLEEKIGELGAGLQADFTAISLKGIHQLPSYDPVSTLVFTSSGRDVVLTVVAGREVFKNGQVTTVNEVELREKMQRTQDKLKEYP
jgi:5-methylthioadenosine/S-adenosylhomocysteine deaminase